MRSEQWLGVLGERNFRLYFLGRFTSFIGTGMLPVALSFAVLGRGGSTSDVGYVLAAEWAPLAVFLLVAGVLADRFQRRRVMVCADLLRALAQGVLAGWILLGHPPLWGFVVCELAVGTGTAFFTPAMTGLIPEVSSAERLAQANAFNSLAQWTGTLVGPAVGGIVVAAAGPGWAVGADAVSYGVSALCLAALRAQWRRGAGDEPFLRRLAEGWEAFRTRTWLWTVVAQFSLLGLVVFPAFFVLGAVTARDSLGGAPAWGAILASQGAGSVLGALLMLRIRPRRPLVVAELAMFGWVPPLALLAAGAPVAAVAVGGFAAGLGFGVFGPLWDTTMQKELPPEVLSRASAYDWFGSLVFLPVGFSIVGAVTEVLGLTTTLVVAACWAGLSTAAVLAVGDVRGLRWSSASPAGAGPVAPPAQPEPAAATGHLGVG
ncbi:MAG TPA: MFS transporter [Acidimicrobiales bacterium]|nr:MFS transporter [Acidimicrobiales bacterium]